MSALRARGLEAYGELSWEDGIRRMHALRLRKVIANTSVLQAVRHDSTSEITNNSFLSPNEVTMKLGTKFRGISLHELLDQIVAGDPLNNHCTPGRKGENPIEYPIIDAHEVLDQLEDHSNLMTIFHSVGNRKMHGFDKPESEYAVEPFAYSADLRRLYRRASYVRRICGT